MIKISYTTISKGDFEITQEIPRNTSFYSNLSRAVGRAKFFQEQLWLSKLYLTKNSILCICRETCYYTSTSPSRWYHRYDSEGWKRESSWVLLTFIFICDLESINTSFSRMLQGWEALYYGLFNYYGLLIFRVWVYQFALWSLKEIAFSLLW